jgi:hypothetical protein
MHLLLKSFCLLFSIVLLLNPAYCQNNNNCSLSISLLTCSSGKDLYTSFGHTALRIKDVSNNTDLVYNYGTFDFNDPGFYLKFVKGKLNYYLSVQDYYDFLWAYQQENRGVIDQELKLDCKQKEAIVQQLAENVLPQNRYYKYDYIQDNCTTRIRDLLFKNANGYITKNIIPANTSARNLIDNALANAGQWWGRLGIDILFGSNADKPLTNVEAMFLPELLMQGIDSATKSNGPSMVLKKTKPVEVKHVQKVANNLDASLIIISAVCFVLFLLCALKYRNGDPVIKVIDFTLFASSGLAGLLILFMWFGTEHIICRNNYNLVWAIPFNLIAAFTIFNNRYPLRWYFISLSVIYLLLLISWYWLPQQLTIALLPVVLLLLYKSIQRAGRPAIRNT